MLIRARSKGLNIRKITLYSFISDDDNFTSRKNVVHGAPKTKHLLGPPPPHLHQPANSLNMISIFWPTYLSKLLEKGMCADKFDEIRFYNAISVE